MSKADFSTVAGIKAEIASIAKAGKTLDGRIQRCAVAAFEHMLAHRDHTLLVELYQALSKGMRRASMAAWIMQFTQLTANTDAASKAEKPFVLDKEKAFDLETAKEAARVLMDKEKKFRKMPNEKPPRRQTFNLSETRDYRNEYQREYRAEHGNGDRKL